MADEQGKLSNWGGNQIISGYLQNVAYHVVNTLVILYILKFPHNHWDLFSYNKNKIQSKRFLEFPSKWPPTSEFLHFGKIRKNLIILLLLNFINIQ